MDMGCAYGNTVIAALKNGTKSVIACDLAAEHLDEICEQVSGTELASHLITKQDKFPEGFNFEEGSISAIHASHLLEYLRGEEVERGLANFFRWLEPGGKLFLVCYTVFILELCNQKFTREYRRRVEEHTKWPGYLENFDEYSQTPETVDTGHNGGDLAFPVALHMYDIPVLREALIEQGFEIESAEYLDGKTNGAVEETWHDGREYIGIIARKPAL